MVRGRKFCDITLFHEYYFINNSPRHSDLYLIYIYIYIYFFFFPFSATSVVYGSSWAREKICARAVTYAAIVATP